MLRQLQALRLIVRAYALPIQFIRLCEHLLVNQTSDYLPMLEDKWHLARAHLEDRARTFAAGACITESRIKKSGVMHAKFPDQRIERHHLRGVAGRYLHGCL